MIPCAVGDMYYTHALISLGSSDASGLARFVAHWATCDVCRQVYTQRQIDALKNVRAAVIGERKPDERSSDSV